MKYSTSVRSSFFRYASANVLGMLGLSCYILADTFFISLGVGADGLTALNLALPVYSAVRGCGLMLGMGGATRYSIYQGRADRETTDAIFSHALMTAAILAGLFFCSGLTISSQLASLLGADGQVFSMTRTYLQVILLFSPLFICNETLLCFVRNDGAPQLAMTAMLGGSLSNILLDYIFIFPCGLGIFGAVLATGMAPAVSMLILSPYFLKGRSHFRLTIVRPTRTVIIPLITAGIPSLVAELSSGVVILCFNQIILSLAGNLGVAAYGIIANLSLVVLSVYTGIAQGVQPLLCQSYGSQNLQQLSDYFSLAVRTVIIISVLLYGILALGAAPITAVFNSEGNIQLADMAMEGMRLYFLGCLPAGFNILLCVFFTSTDRPLPAHLLSLTRGFFLILPAAFLLARLWAMTGVWLSFPVAEYLTALAGFLLYLRLRPTRSVD